MENIAERREFLRANMNIFINEQNADDFQVAKAVDICEAGMRYLKRPKTSLSQDAEVTLVFQLPETDFPILVKGKIVLDQKTENTQSTSVNFTEIHHKDAHRIREYVIARKRAELFSQMRRQHLVDYL